MNGCRSLRRLSLGLHSHLSDNDFAPLDYNAEQTTIQEPTLIQELDLEHYHGRLFNIELLKRCPELRHLRLPPRFTNIEAGKLHALIPIHCAKLEGVHAELDTGSDNTLHLVMDAASSLRYLSASCREARLVSNSIVHAVMETMQYRSLETIIIKNVGGTSPPRDILVSLLEQCTNLKVFISEFRVTTLRIYRMPWYSTNLETLEMGLIVKTCRVFTGEIQLQESDEERQKKFFEKITQQLPRLERLVLWKAAWDVETLALPLEMEPVGLEQLQGLAHLKDLEVYGKRYHLV